MQKEDGECSYCCLTSIALIIAFTSAIFTLAVASYMYNGNEKIEIPHEIKSLSVDHLLVANKKIVILRLVTLKKCYLLPSYLVKRISKQRLREEPLDIAALQSVGGEEALDFCRDLKSSHLDFPEI